MSRTASRLPGAAAAIATATMIAACGTTSPSAASSASHTTQGQTLQAAVSFASCMRSHGVPFPDPTTSPHSFKSAFAPNSALAQSPRFEPAYGTCRHLLPTDSAPNQTAPRSQAQIAAALAFARCLRSHGFPSFPDPTSNGDLTHEMLASAGIDIHQPAATQAADACVGVTHGFITKAAVARFVAGH